MRLRNLLLLILLTSTALQAQDTRYIDEVFDSVTVSKDNLYGVNLTVLGFPQILPDTLLYDMYMPHDDTASLRPLVVILHTGTFIPRGFAAPTGDKDDYANIATGTRLAQRGYVAASIEYRIGWNPQAPSDVERRAGILQAAYRSIQDMFTFIRFMNMTVDDLGNPYRVDMDKVAVYGIGTGGFVCVNAAVLDKWREEIFINKYRNPVDGTPFIDTTLLGDLTGEAAGTINIPNHVGYGNDFHFAFGLDAAAGDSSWMDIGEPTMPLVFSGNVMHPTTPFGIDPITGEIDCERPVFTGAGSPLYVVDIAGSACLAEKANSLGYNDPLKKFIWDDDVSNALRSQPFAQEHLWAINTETPQTGPWEYWDSTFWKTIDSPLPEFDNIHEAGLATNPDMSLEKANAHIDTALWFFSPRACVTLGLGDCGDITSGLDDLVESEYEFTIAPNPAANEALISVNDNERITNIVVFDMFGRVVLSKTNVNEYVYRIDVNDLPAGMYGIRASVGNNKGFLSGKLMVQH